MTDYSNWKVLKSVCNYEGDDPQKQKEAQAAQAEADKVNDWCNENHYMIDEDELYYFTTPRSPITHEDVEKLREAAYEAEVDCITAHIQRLRDEEQTPEIEAEIAELVAERAEKVAEIKERYPYPDNANDEVA